MPLGQNLHHLMTNTVTAMQFHPTYFLGSQNSNTTGTHQLRHSVQGSASNGRDERAASCSTDGGARLALGLP